jgi:hypothetical protein
MTYILWVCGILSLGKLGARERPAGFFALRTRPDARMSSKPAPMMPLGHIPTPGGPRRDPLPTGGLRARGRGRPPTPEGASRGRDGPRPTPEGRGRARDGRGHRRRGRGRGHRGGEGERGGVQGPREALGDRLRDARAFPRLPYSLPRARP